MKTDIQPLSQVIRDAAAITDPDGHDDTVLALLTAFEDDDRPAIGIEDLEGELRGSLRGIDPEGDSPAAAATAALALFTATSPDHADRPEPTLRHATRLWFGDDVPQPVEDWLRDSGVNLAG